MNILLHLFSFLDAFLKTQRMPSSVIPANPPEVYPPALWRIYPPALWRIYPPALWRVYPPLEGGQELESRKLEQPWTPASAGVTTFARVPVSIHSWTPKTLYYFWFL
jgi:hypothetical protein